MELLYILESLRTPLLDEIMLLVTRFGEETAFLAAALVVFWCVDKRKGYYVMAVGFLGTMVNQLLKLLCAVPRPWVLDPEFTIVEAAREAATGFSFPSGHTQSAVGTFGALAVSMKNRWGKGLCISIALLVPISRMYLGVHTPWDVLVGAGISLALVLALKPMLQPEQERTMKTVVTLMLVCALGLLLYTECFPFGEGMDAHNLASGRKNAYTMLGCLVGVAIVYVVEKRYVNFETKACWWSQALKVALGLGVVLLVKEGLRSPLEAVLPVYPARAVRYFCIVLTAGLVWPMTFRWFSKLGGKK